MPKPRTNHVPKYMIARIATSAVNPASPIMTSKRQIRMQPSALSFSSLRSLDEDMHFINTKKTRPPATADSA